MVSSCFVFPAPLFNIFWTCADINQEQAGEWERERVEFDKEIGELKEDNERLTSELNTRSLTVDKLKNKVRSTAFYAPRFTLVWW